MTTSALGIDIGGTHIRALAEVSSSRGEIIKDKVANDLDSLVRQIVDLARPTEPITIGITLPGRIENNWPAWIPNLSFLDGTDLVTALKTQLSAEIKLINDAQAALLAEAREGAAAGLKHVALIAIGTGIGGAVLINGQIFTGATGTAGSFGWMPAVNFDSSNLTQPINSGPWEQTASGSSLIQIAHNWENVDKLLIDLNDGNAAAADVVNEFGNRLGEGFAAIASVFDPELIVVAGGVSAMLEMVRPTIEKLMQLTASPTGRQVKFKQAQLGVDAGVVGALIAGIESGKNG